MYKYLAPEEIKGPWFADLSETNVPNDDIWVALKNHKYPAKSMDTYGMFPSEKPHYLSGSDLPKVVLQGDILSYKNNDYKLRRSRLFSAYRDAYNK